MALFVDAVVAYPDEAANFTAPADEWCHLVSDASLDELAAFAAGLGIGPDRIRVPPDTTATHINLTHDERDAAVAGGATELGGRAMYGRTFDAPGPRGSF